MSREKANLVNSCKCAMRPKPLFNFFLLAGVLNYNITMVIYSLQNSDFKLEQTESLVCHYRLEFCGWTASATCTNNFVKKIYLIDGFGISLAAAQHVGVHHSLERSLCLSAGRGDK